MATDIPLVTEVISPDIKRQALELYLEGLGFRSICRFLKCSHVSVDNWAQAYGESIEAIRSETGVKIVEMDEMHTLFGVKKTIAGSGLLSINMGNVFSHALWLPATQKLGGNYGEVVLNHVPFQDFTLSLLSQLMKNIPQKFTNLSIQDFRPTFGHKYSVIFAVPFRMA